jgi:hypothetical protein
VDSLLHLLSCMNTAYGFLLAQHIPPAWPKLAGLMERLFPQVGGCTWVLCGFLVGCCGSVRGGGVVCAHLRLRQGPRE